VALARLYRSQCRPPLRPGVSENREAVGTMAQAVRAPSGQAAPIRPAPPAKSPWFVGFYRSALGKKYVMAVTGIIFMFYVLMHMIGNLKMYIGQEEFDEYAEFLRHILYPILPESGFLWIFRIVLLVALLFHLHASWSLTVLNRRARPMRYQAPRHYVAANLASRTMRWTGIIVLIFLLFHLADLTFGWANPDFESGDVYDNVVASFERVPVAALYIVGNLALGVHLFHGAWSIFQSLGVNNPRFNAWRRWFAVAFTVVVVAGNLTFPIAVLAGVVGT
jgi:succinate dehydrogenase / fumarate reductase cytochrome b subunit